MFGCALCSSVLDNVVTVLPTRLLLFVLASKLVWKLLGMKIDTQLIKRSNKKPMFEINK